MHKVVLSSIASILSTFRATSKQHSAAVHLNSVSSNVHHLRHVLIGEVLVVVDWEKGKSVSVGGPRREEQETRVGLLFLSPKMKVRSPPS